MSQYKEINPRNCKITKIWLTRLYIDKKGPRADAKNWKGDGLYDDN